MSIPNAPASVAERVNSESPVAVLVCHGMGQQVPFETLDCVAKSVRQGLGDEASQWRSRVRLVIDDHGSRIPRAEAEFVLDGARHEVHFYEAYWAPITEGKVTLRDALRFLFDAGWDGIRFSIPYRRFTRVIFGKVNELNVKLSTGFALVITLAVVVALAGLYVAMGATAVVEVAHRLVPDWNVPRSIWTVRSILGGYLAGTVAGGVLFAVVMLLLRRLRRLCYAVLSAVLALIALLAVDAVVEIIVALMGGVPWLLADVPGSLLIPGYVRLSGAILVPLAWLLAIALAAIFRSFLVEYVGDVAVYVSAHKVNRYGEIRRAIQNSALDVAKEIYRAEDGARLRYRHVVIAGHSLGSVVAYDTLNAMINYDEAHGGTWHVLERTNMLMTCGSPLDKTAFIFRSQLKNAVFREALATAVQPLIAQTEYRRVKWVNIFSKADWISGKLDYYGEPLDNILDTDGYVPFLAHTQYFDHQAVSEALCEGILQQKELVGRPIPQDAATNVPTIADPIRAASA